MDLSIVIPSFNTRLLIDRCLESINASLKNSKLDFEIIVVDNASTDGTKQLLNNKYIRVIKIFNKKNIGYGQANNLGINKAMGEYILLLNSDVKVIGDSIYKLFEFTRRSQKSFVGGKLLNEDGTPQPSCGPGYTLPVAFLMLFLKGDHYNITRYSPNKIRKVDWVSGACIMAKKADFLKLGLFDNKIFMYMEEIDLLYRARISGYTVYFYPEARFIHSGAASSGNRKQPVVNIYQGLWYFYQKHMSVSAQIILLLLLKLKAYLVITVSRLLRAKNSASIYEQALQNLK